MAHKNLVFTLIFSLLAAALLSVAAPHASATSPVTVRFAADGFSGFSGQIVTIDGVGYTVSDLGWRTFSWTPGSAHSISAVSSFRNTDYPSKNFTFQSWTNGEGLVGNQGTYTTPSADSTVTMHYVLATHLATFALTGVTYYSNQIIEIDGVTYTVSDLGWRT